MKAEELRIGNYVWNEVIDKAIPLNYTGIIDVNDKPSKYSPIQLTEEWLIKMGFERDLQLEKYNNDLKEYKLGCINSSSFYRICYHNKGGYTFRYRGAPLNKIYHVHNLQNIIHALTGEELTIKND